MFRSIVALIVSSLSLTACAGEDPGDKGVACEQSPEAPLTGKALTTNGGYLNGGYLNSGYLNTGYLNTGT